MNGEKIKLWVLHFLWGLLAASWNGGVSAVAAILGVDTIGMTSATAAVRVLNWKEMLAAFAGGFVIHGFIWLVQHRIPQPGETSAPFGNKQGTPPPLQ